MSASRGADSERGRVRSQHSLYAPPFYLSSCCVAACGTRSRLRSGNPFALEMLVERVIGTLGGSMAFQLDVIVVVMNASSIRPSIKSWNVRVALGVACAGPLGVIACVPQNQDELQQLRAEVATLASEVEALKAQRQEEAPEPAAATPASTATAAAPAPAPKPSWEEQIKGFKSEKKDRAWARLREAPLLKVATEHIKGSGASLQSVSCKTTGCLIVVDVPQKSRVPYQPLTNPWAGTDLTTHTKPTYAKRTRWSYLLSRHEKDYEKFGAERVDPLQAAKAGEPTRPAVAASSQKQEVAAAEPTASQPVSTSAPAASAPPSENEAEPPKASGKAMDKPAAKLAPQKSAPKTPAPPAASAAPPAKAAAAPAPKK
jgi:hypothetical protein